MSTEYKMVPVEPTEEMMRAGMDVSNTLTKWQVMLAAAPLSPQGDAQLTIMGREQFEAWVLGREHPVYGWLDKHWLERGDDPENYAEGYVQGLWVASRALYTRPDAGEVEDYEAMKITYMTLKGEAVSIQEDIKRRIHHFARRNGQMPTLLILGPDKRDELVGGLSRDERFGYQWRTSTANDRYLGLEIVETRGEGVVKLALGEN